MDSERIGDGMDTRINLERHGIYVERDGETLEVCSWDEPSDANDGDMDHVTGLLPRETGEQAFGVGAETALAPLDSLGTVELSRVAARYPVSAVEAERARVSAAYEVSRADRDIVGMELWRLRLAAVERIEVSS